MLPYRDSRFTILALGIFFLIAILYALFEARGQLLGPTINIDTRVSIVQDPFLIIEGQAKRISSRTATTGSCSTRKIHTVDRRKKCLKLCTRRVKKRLRRRPVGPLRRQERTPPPCKNRRQQA